MKSENKNKEIADRIIEILQSGLTINTATQHYIDSTFSNPTIAALEKLLQDKSSCEIDSLIELLLFPDESVQMQLEDLLENARVQEQDQQSITALICAQPLQARLHFADGRGTLTLAVSPWDVSTFIRRLNLSRALDPKIRAAIAQYVRRSFQTRCNVRLRNAKPITAPSIISFLQSFFEKLQADDDDFFEHLDYILGFVADLKDQTDIFQALMDQKKFYFQSLQKAANLDRQLTKHNVETLLLRGRRVAYVDKADARKKIRRIDRISLAVFGQTDFFDLMPADEQSITLDSKDAMRRLIKEFN